MVWMISCETVPAFDTGTPAVTVAGAPGWAVPGFSDTVTAGITDAAAAPAVSTSEMRATRMSRGRTSSFYGAAHADCTQPG